MKHNKRSILFVSLLAEGVLIASFYIWGYLRPLPALGSPTLSDLLLGAAYSMPLFALNFLLFGPLAKFFPKFERFKVEIVYPLAKMLDWRYAIAISILAGVGEELFFRGLLVEETGIIISSILFSVLHFFPAVKEYYSIAIVYFFIGVYFALIYQHSGGLWVPIFTHIIYDFVVLIYLKYLHKSA